MSMSQPARSLKTASQDRGHIGETDMVLAGVDGRLDAPAPGVGEIDEPERRAEQKRKILIRLARCRERAHAVFPDRHILFGRPLPRGADETRSGNCMAQNDAVRLRFRLDLHHLRQLRDGLKPPRGIDDEKAAVALEADQLDLGNLARGPAQALDRIAVDRVEFRHGRHDRPRRTRAQVLQLASSAVMS